METRKIIKMTQISAICKSLLSGETLSIMNGFKYFGCTNLPREISRGIEKPFQVIISRMKMDFTSKYGQSGYYYQYRLNPLIEGNAEGIKKMIEYVKEHDPTFSLSSPRTEKEQKISSQIKTASDYSKQILSATPQTLFP